MHGSRLPNSRVNMEHIKLTMQQFPRKQYFENTFPERERLNFSGRLIILDRTWFRDNVTDLATTNVLFTALLRYFPAFTI